MMIDETQAAPASQPPTQGKINIGTMDVSDSDSDEEGQVCTSNECIVLFISFARLNSIHEMVIRPFMLGAPLPLAM